MLNNRAVIDFTAFYLAKILARVFRFFGRNPSPLRLSYQRNKRWLGSGRPLYLCRQKLSIKISNFFLAAKDAAPTPCANNSFNR